MLTRAKPSRARTDPLPSRTNQSTITLCLDPAAESVVPDDMSELSRHLTLQIISKDLEALANMMRQTDRAPDCLIIELGRDKNGFLRGLELLAPTLPATTKVFVFGQLNDIGLYRTLLDLGIEDYFVGHANSDMITTIVTRLDASDTGDAGAIIGIQGIAGGVGASTFAVNLAAQASIKTDRAISIIEAGDCLHSSRFLLDPTDLATLVSGDETALDDVIVRGRNKSHEHGSFRLTMPRAGMVFAAGTDDTHARHLGSDLVAVGIRRRINRETIIFDLGGSPDPATVLAHCDHIVFVAEPDFKCLALCRQHVENARSRYPYATLHLVITQSGVPNRTEFRNSDFERETGLTALSAFRYHAAGWTAALSQGLPILPLSLLRTPQFFDDLLLRLGFTLPRSADHTAGLWGVFRRTLDRFVRTER